MYSDIPLVWCFMYPYYSYSVSLFSLLGSVQTKCAIKCEKSTSYLVSRKTTTHIFYLSYFNSSTRFLRNELNMREGSPRCILYNSTVFIPVTIFFYFLLSRIVDRLRNGTINFVEFVAKIQQNEAWMITKG